MRLSRPNITKQQTEDRHDTSEMAVILKWAVIVAAILCLFRIVIVSRDQLAAHYDLVFETPNLTSTLLIKEGKNPYDRSLYDHPPYIITVYTPLYHYLVSLFPVDKANPFFYGRIVACVFMLGAALSLFLVDIKQRQPVLSFVAFALFFVFWPVTKNTVYLKTDTLALFLSVFAVVVAHNFRTPFWAPVLSAILCVLAVATKQYFVAAGVTCAVFYLLSNPRNFIIFAVVSLLSTLLFIVVVMTCWGEGFWFSTFGVLRNEMSFDRGFKIFSWMYSQPLVWFLLILTVVLSWQAIKHNAREVFRDTPYFMFVLASAAVVLIIIWRVGSSTNYFYEFLLAQLFWIVYMLRQHTFDSLMRKRLQLVVILFLACCVYEFTMVEPTEYSFANKITRPKLLGLFENIRRNITSLEIENPKILNLFSHRETFFVTDRVDIEKVFVNDPGGYRVFWEEGKIDAQPMIDSLHNQSYDVILLRNGTKPRRQNPNPYDKILEAVFANYRLANSGPLYGYFVKK